MALVAVVVAGVSDKFSAGRNHRRIVRAFAIRKRAQGAVGNTEFVNFIVEVGVIGFGVAIDRNDQKLAVRRPGSPRGAEFVAAVREIAIGDLARCAAFALADEDLHVAGLERACPVEAIDQAVVAGGASSTLSAGGRRL